MDYFIKPNAFSLKDRFTIMNNDGLGLLYAESEFPALGHMLRLYTMSGTEVAFIKKHLYRLAPSFEVFMSGVSKMEVTKKGSIKHPAFEVDGKGWMAEGDFTAHVYSVHASGILIGKITDDGNHTGEAIGIHVPDAQNALEVLCVSLAIDCAAENT